MKSWLLQAEERARALSQLTRGAEARTAEQDVALLAQTDTLHGTLSGPTTKRLLVRALELYGDPRVRAMSEADTGSSAERRHLHLDAGLARLFQV